MYVTNEKAQQITLHKEKNGWFFFFVWLIHSWISYCARRERRLNKYKSETQHFFVISLISEFSLHSRCLFHRLNRHNHPQRHSMNVWTNNWLTAWMFRQMWYKIWLNIHSIFPYNCSKLRLVFLPSLYHDRGYFRPFRTLSKYCLTVY